MGGSNNQPATKTRNPYVGPRPFEPGEHLVGRDREIAELYYLLSAERIVLLHSPSGAGKSSLINAGLLPRLRERFDVWQPTRVSLQPPADISPVRNRYTLSAALGFEQGIPKERRRSPRDLAGMGLLEHAKSLPRPDSAKPNVLLIFDQFEEILTTGPLDIECKNAFFDQLGELLRDTKYSALFAMREDYLAPLDPYADRVPTHLNNRLRIDLLSTDQAREAIAVPASESGRPFSEDAADRLVFDLARMKVQQPDGSFREQTGLHVEPLQLQVVCRGLWDRMPAESAGISLLDVDKFGNVTEALSTYYSDEVAKISGDNLVLQREMREWVGEQLITPEGIRSQVLRGKGQSKGLDNTVIEQLVHTHLVRSEPRAGAVWYELAHDRLIEPVRTNNAAWREQNLHQLQKRAIVWNAQERPPAMLLLDSELDGAIAWAESQKRLTEVETDFLNASREAQKAAIKERRQARLRRWLTIVSTAGFLLAIVAATAFLYMLRQSNFNRAVIEVQKERVEDQEKEASALTRKANWEKWLADGERLVAENSAADARKEGQEARDQGEIALSGRLIAQARTQPPNLLPFGTLLALESMKRSPSAEADEYLRHSLALLRSPAAPPIPQGTNFGSTVFGPGALLVATDSTDGTYHISDVATGHVRFTVPNPPGTRLRFSNNGQYLAVWSSSSSAKLLNTTNGKQVYEAVGPEPAHGFTFIVFSNDSQYLAGTISAYTGVWKIGGSNHPVLEVSPDSSDKSPGAASSPVFSGDNKYFVTARKNEATVWSVGSWKSVKGFAFMPPSSGPAPPASLGIGTSEMVCSPDGKWFAIRNSIYKTSDWTVSYTIPSLVGAGSSFSPDSRYFMNRLLGGVTIWPVSNWANPIVLPTEGPTTAATFSPTSDYLATASDDNTAHIWRVQSASFNPFRFTTLSQLINSSKTVAREVGRMSHSGKVNNIVFNQRGDQLVTNSSDSIQRWQAVGNGAGVTPYPTSGDRPLVAISLDGTTVVWGSSTTMQTFQVGDDGKPANIRMFVSGPGETILSFDISDNARYLVASIGKQLPGKAGQIDPNALTQRVWDLSSDRKVSDLPVKDFPLAFLFSPDGHYLMTLHQKDVVEVRDLRSGKIKLNTGVGTGAGYWYIKRFLFSPSSQYFVAIGADNNIHIWNTTDWTTRTLLSTDEVAHSLTFSRTQDVLAASSVVKSANGLIPGDSIRVWRAPDWRPETEINHKLTSAVDNTSFALSPSGDVLATANWNSNLFLRANNVSFWRKGTQLEKQIPLQNLAIGLAFNQDGKYLAIVTDDKLAVWDQQNNRQLASVDTQSETLTAVFSPKGDYILTLDYSGSALSWFWRSERVTSSVCHLLGVNLSPKEWKENLHGEPYEKTCPNLPPGHGYSQGLAFVPASVSDDNDRLVLAPVKPKSASHKQEAP